MKISITLPLPHKSLSPNKTIGSLGARLGKSAATKKYRKAAEMLARSEMKGDPWPAAEVQCTFYHKIARKRDKDNALASMKAAFDGIADAGVVADDSDITYLPVVMLKSKENPRVEIEITRKEVKL